MNRIARCLVVAIASLSAVSLAWAQWGFTPQWAFNGAPQAQMLHSSYVLQQLAAGTYLKGTGKSTSAAKPVPAAKSTAALTFDPVSRPIAPARLAQTYPADNRAQVEQTFNQTLEGYRKIEAQFGIRRNDIGGALAAFVAGNYAAYRNEPFPDKLFKPLVAQMQGALQSSGTLEKIGAAEKQELYESLAILGTFMALTREAMQKNPNDKVAANVKSAARGYLEQSLKLDPDRMKLTEQGLVLN